MKRIMVLVQVSTIIRRSQVDRIYRLVPVIKMEEAPLIDKKLHPDADSR